MKYSLTFLGDRALTLFAVFVLAFGVISGLQPKGVSAEAEAGKQSQNLDRQAKLAVEEFANAVASGNVDTVRQHLAPEYQILRSDGKGYDKEQYLTGGMSKIKSIISVQDVVATAHGNLMVVRWVISLKATADGEIMQKRAPRLTVFRREGNRWLVVAHANFAHLEK